MWFFSKKSPQYQLQNLIFQSELIIHYSLYDGIRISDKKQFSIFEIKIDPTSQLQQALSKNALKTWKTLRHPAIPIFYDSYENDGNQYVVTEKLLPFNNYKVIHNDKKSENENSESKDQSESLTDNEILWATHVLTDFVCFLGDTANAIHGFIQNESLFMTYGHEIKIAGLHWMTINGNGPINDYYSCYQDLVLNINHYQPDNGIHIDPNCTNDEIKVTQNRDKTMNFYSTIDSKFVGLFISNNSLQLPERILSYGTFWSSDSFLSFASYYESFGTFPPTPKMLLDDQLCWNQFANQNDKKESNNEFIYTILFLKDLPLKEADDRIVFFQHLNKILSIFSIQTQEYTLLPILISSLSYTKSTKETPLILEVIFSIGSNPKISKDSFENFIIPSVVPLFESKDRNIRIHLLKNIDNLINHFNPKLINEKIFPNIIIGMNDTIAAMKSATIISMVSLAPKLNKDNIKYLIRELRKLQVNDQDPSIRCNSVICITKIAEYIDDDLRIQILLNSFTTALKDSFSSTRKAAITGFKVCKKYFSAKSDIIANNILVMLAPLCNDSAIDNRILAIKTMKDYLDILMSENNQNNEDCISSCSTADEKLKNISLCQQNSSFNSFQDVKISPQIPIHNLNQTQSNSAFPPPQNVALMNPDLNNSNDHSNYYFQSSQNQDVKQSFPSSSVIAHYPSSDQNILYNNEVNNPGNDNKINKTKSPFEYDEDEYWRIIKAQPPKPAKSEEVRDAMMLFSNPPTNIK